MFLVLCLLALAGISTRGAGSVQLCRCLPSPFLQTPVMPAISNWTQRPCLFSDVAILAMNIVPCCAAISFYDLTTGWCTSCSVRRFGFKCAFMPERCILCRTRTHRVISALGAAIRSASAKASRSRENAVQLMFEPVSRLRQWSVGRLSATLHRLRQWHVHAQLEQRELHKASTKRCNVVTVVLQLCLVAQLAPSRLAPETSRARAALIRTRRPTLARRAVSATQGESNE